MSETPQQKPQSIAALEHALALAMASVDQEVMAAVKDAKYTTDGVVDYSSRRVRDAVDYVVKVAKELARFEAPTMQSIAVREDRVCNVYITMFDEYGQPKQQCITERRH